MKPFLHIKILKYKIKYKGLSTMTKDFLHPVHLFGETFLVSTMNRWESMSQNTIKIVEIGEVLTFSEKFKKISLLFFQLSVLFILTCFLKILGKCQNFTHFHQLNRVLRHRFPPIQCRKQIYFTKYMNRGYETLSPHPNSYKKD